MASLGQFAVPVGADVGKYSPSCQKQPGEAANPRRSALPASTVLRHKKWELANVVVSD